MKICRWCGEEKQLTDFYKGKGMLDGHINVCKPCKQRRAIENRNARLDYYRAYDRARGNRQSAEYTRAYRAANPEKWKAHCVTNNAVRDGRLNKPCACTVCGKTGRIEGHHKDYSKPLEVTWACAACHRGLHA